MTNSQYLTLNIFLESVLDLIMNWHVDISPNFLLDYFRNN